jgi:hypothetical protein
VLDNIRPLRKAAANNGKLTNSITVFPAPDAYQAQYRPATGYEWSTYGLWDADNRRRGAAITYFINKPQRPDTARTQPADNAPLTGPGRFAGQATGGRRGDSVMVRIYNSGNELIRTLRWNADTGFNRQYWGMDEKGFRQPGSPKPQPGAPEPGGFQVLPGTYKVVITYARVSDSTFVTIKDDPRIGNRNDIKMAQRKMYDRLRKSADKLTEGMDRLTEAEEVCNKMQAQLKGVEGKDADSLRKSTTKMLDEIKAIRDLINGKTSDKQGLARNPFEVTVMNQLQAANQAIGSKMVVPGAAEETMIVNAEKAIDTIIQKINAFFEGKWKDYRQQAENTKFSLFKDYKPL